MAKKKKKIIGITLLCAGALAAGGGIFLAANYANREAGGASERCEPKDVFVLSFPKKGKASNQDGGEAEAYGRLIAIDPSTGQTLTEIDSYGRGYKTKSTIKWSNGKPTTSYSTAFCQSDYRIGKSADDSMATVDVQAILDGLGFGIEAKKLDYSLLSYLRKRQKPSTVYGKWGIFNRYVSPKMGKGAVSQERSWWQSLNERCCKAYRGIGTKRVSQVIRDYMRYLCSKGLSIDPAWCQNEISYEPHKPAPKEVWSLDEFNLFYATLDSDMKRLLFSILFFYGLRVNECLALKHSDFGPNCLHVGATVSIKNIERRLMVTSPKTKSSSSSLPMLGRVWQLYERMPISLADGFVFTFGNGRPVGMTSVSRWLRDGAKKAGLREISPHCLRDSCATWLFSEGADIRLVSRWLRHSSISVTMDCYLRLYGNELGDFSKKVDSLISGPEAQRKPS